MTTATAHIIRLAGGHEIQMSYGVPVAALIIGTGLVQDARKYSVTTSKHVNAFIAGREHAVVEHDAFMRLVAPVVSAT